MIILFVIGILLGAVAVVFALQNVAVITVSFFSWQLTGSLALILLIAITSGMLVAIFLLMPEFITSYFKARSLQKENAKLAEELRKQKELTAFAKNPTEGGISPVEREKILL